MRTRRFVWCAMWQCFKAERAGSVAMGIYFLGFLERTNKKTI